MRKETPAIAAAVRMPSSPSPSAPSPRRCWCAPRRPPPNLARPSAPAFRPTRFVSSATPMNPLCSSPSSPPAPQNSVSTTSPRPSRSKSPRSTASSSSGRPRRIAYSSQPPHTQARNVGRNLAHLPGRRLPLSRRPWRLLPGQSLARRFARRRGHRQSQWQSRLGPLRRRRTLRAQACCQLRPRRRRRVRATRIAALEHNLREHLGATPSAPPPSTSSAEAHNADRPDLIVVDPPRTGLGAETSPLISPASPRPRSSTSPATPPLSPAISAPCSPPATQSNPSPWPTSSPKPSTSKPSFTCNESEPAPTPLPIPKTSLPNPGFLDHKKVRLCARIRASFQFSRYAWPIAKSSRPFVPLPANSKACSQIESMTHAPRLSGPAAFAISMLSTH